MNPRELNHYLDNKAGHLSKLSKQAGKIIKINNEMKQYRLKREALQFFDDNYRRWIYPYSVWEEKNISLNALEEVEPVYISYGMDKKGYTDLCGWGNDDGSHFNFTVNFPLTSNKEHNQIKERMSDIMRDIQLLINERTKDIV